MSNNPLIYLFGYPGTGKKTTAMAIEQQSDYIAIQNHLLSNPLRHILSRQSSGDYTKTETLLKHHTMKAWVNFLEFIASAAPDKGLIFTSVLYQNEPDRVTFFEFVRKWAIEQKREFIPVRLVCDQEELIRRLQSPSRDQEMKLTDPEILKKLMMENQLLQPDNGFELDITHLTPEQAAQKILSFIE